MEELNMKQVIYKCIGNILNREQKEYAKLKEIYEEVSRYLEVENDYVLQSQIRGRLQENCNQYAAFTGEPLFLTERVRSGNWALNVNKKKYIRHIGNTYLVTNDNWLSVEKVKNITNEYEQDINEANIFKAKIIDSIGKDHATIIIGELNKINALLKDLKNIDDNKGYGFAFEVFATSVNHNIEYEDCINQYIIHGNLDAGIDAIFYNDPNYIYIYQIKTGSNIKDDAYQKMRKSFDDCIKGIIPEDGKHLYNFIEKHRFELKEKKPIYKSVSENSVNPNNIKPKDIFHKFLENRLLPISNNNITLNIFKPKIGQDYNISMDSNNNFIFYLKASELIDALLTGLGITRDNYDKEKIDLSKYFTDNVRGVLSVNKKMVSTILNEPENFVKYNNGINITGEVTDLGNQIMIKNPVINNGQQTLTTLIKIDNNLEDIILPIKVTNENNMVIKASISRYSNEQVKVKAIDILSLNFYVRDIQDKLFKHPYNGERYFLQIYSSGKKSYYEIVKRLYKDNNVIALLDFIKLYFSCENKKELGAWKNSPNTQVDKTEIADYFDENKSLKVCEATARYLNYIENIESKKEKDDFKSADLAFKYLICKEELTDLEAANIIKKINKKYYYDKKEEKSKLIDIYKSSNIINKLEVELELFKNNKVNS